MCNPNLESHKNWQNDILILREDKRLTKQAPNLSQQAAAILKDSLDVSSTFTGYTPR